MKSTQIALALAILLSVSSGAFAANYSQPNSASDVQKYEKDQRYYENGQQDNQEAMFRLSERRKHAAPSMWDSMCDFFGTHGHNRGERNRH